MRLSVGLFGALGALSAAGCATAPIQMDIQRSATVERPFDTVWDDAVAFFATNSIPIRNIEKDSGLIVAERQVTGMMSGSAFRGWADCGKPGFLEVAEARTVNMNVLVRRESPTRSTITVTALFNETRSFDALRTTVECASTGRLERSILERLGAR